MILPAQAIRRLALDSDLVTPFAERTVAHGMTFGVGPCGYDIRIAQTHLLFPGEFFLGSSIERFRLPDDIMAEVKDKSTLARLGISLFNTCGEPGWHGFWTLEVKNQGRDAVWLHAGMPIAQVVFKRLESPTEQPYAGKYQDQPAGPQPAILEAA